MPASRFACCILRHSSAIVGVVLVSNSDKIELTAYKQNLISFTKPNPSALGWEISVKGYHASAIDMQIFWCGTPTEGKGPACLCPSWVVVVMLIGFALAKTVKELAGVRDNKYLWIKLCFIYTSNKIICKQHMANVSISLYCFTYNTTVVCFFGNSFFQINRCTCIFLYLYSKLL